MRAVDQHRRGWTEWSQRRFRLGHELLEPPFGARYAEHTDESGFSGSEVLAGRFAHQGRIALDVEEIVGNLKRFADRCAKTCKRFALLCAGAAENAAGLAGEAQQRAGLHRLQHPYFALAVTDCAEAAFGCKVEHLAARHAAETGGARQRIYEFNAHGRLRMGFFAR